MPLDLLVAALWIFLAILVMSMSATAALMANDAGNVSAAVQTRMILLVLGGQIVAGAAGIPLGLAIFWRRRGKLLVRLFAALLGLGLLSVVLGIYLFASNLPG